MLTPNRMEQESGHRTHLAKTRGQRGFFPYGLEREAFSVAEMPVHALAVFFGCPASVWGLRLAPEVGHTPAATRASRRYGLEFGGEVLEVGELCRT